MLLKEVEMTQHCFAEAAPVLNSWLSFFFFFFSSKPTAETNFKSTNCFSSRRYCSEVKLLPAPFPAYFPTPILVGWDSRAGPFASHVVNSSCSG